MNADKREALIFPVAVAVLAGWFGSLVVGLLTSSYTALTITTPLMLMLAGYVFGVNIVRRNGNGDDGR
jgi:hypothetical protein